MTAQGLWLSSFLGGVDADKPSPFPGDGNIAFFYASDTKILYVAVRPAAGADVDWQAFMPGLDTTVVSYDADNKTLVFTDMPTSDPGVAGALYSDDGTVKLSAGA
jgi:hypothetical protein